MKATAILDGTRHMPDARLGHHPVHHVAHLGAAFAMPEGQRAHPAQFHPETLAQLGSGEAKTNAVTALNFKDKCAVEKRSDFAWFNFRAERREAAIANRIPIIVKSARFRVFHSAGPIVENLRICARLRHFFPVASSLR